MPNLSDEVCFHEAGHVVAGVSVGLEPMEVRARTDGTGLVEWLYVPGRSIVHLRKSLVQIVAGPYAETLLAWRRPGLPGPRYRYTQQFLNAGYRLPSSRLERGEDGRDDVGCDTFRAHRDGLELCRREKARALGKWNERAANDPKHRGPFIAPRETVWHILKMKPPRVKPEEVVAVVRRAERTADRILREQWVAVVRMAAALQKSKRGLLSGEDAVAIVRGEGAGFKLRRPR